MAILNHDVTIVRGAHWSMSFGYYDPLPNGLADMDSPIDPSGWSLFWVLTDTSGVVPVVVYELDEVDMIIDTDLTVTVPLDSAATAGLPLMIGDHVVTVITDIPGLDEIVIAGRALVTDAG